MILSKNKSKKRLVISSVLFLIRMQIFKRILLILTSVSSFCYGIPYDNIKTSLHGNSSFSSSTAYSFKTDVYVEYNVKLYEPNHKKWGMFLAGKVNPLFDHLGNEIKIDVFTVLGVDF